MEPNLLQVTIHHSMIHAMNQLTRLGGTNLLSNAARHTHQSSAIRMAAEREGVHVAVSVSDDGPSECLSQPILSSTYRANESTLHLSALNISSPPVLLAAVLDQVHHHLGNAWVVHRVVLVADRARHATGQVLVTVVDTIKLFCG